MQMLRGVKRLTTSVTVIVGSTYDQHQTSAAVAHASSFEHSSAGSTARAAVTYDAKQVVTPTNIKQTSIHTPCSLASSGELVTTPQSSSQPNLRVSTDVAGAAGAQPAVVNYDAGSYVCVPKPQTAQELDAQTANAVNTILERYPPTTKEIQTVSAELFGSPQRAASAAVTATATATATAAGAGGAGKIALASNPVINAAAIELAQKMAEDSQIAGRAVESTLIGSKASQPLNALTDHLMCC